MKQDKAIVSLTPLLKAQKRFEEYRADLSTHKDMTAAIKAFEYCYEVSWKLMKRIIENEQHHKLQGTKDVFRVAAQFGLIRDPKAWFFFLDERNTTAHTYDEDIEEEFVKIFPAFSEELEDFVQRAQAKVCRDARDA